MRQSLPRRNPPLRIIDKNLSQQVQKLPVERSRLRDDLLQLFHTPHELSRLARRIWKRIIERIAFEKAGSAVLIVPFGGAPDFADEVFVDSLAGDGLHHREVFATVVGLEERVACPALDEDTAERPQVDWVRPAWCTLVSTKQVRRGGMCHLTYSEDDFWRPIMPRTNHR